ncbi:craniofacial development protein 2-like [Schistocerca piceifrons]|uniref:craniofacial development protein 2-like n=1 Tax=Schistocerca piceifrons TaxID=274613 RepID=UPI001F5F8CC8|nr:craniofacial development protein 2-like [Schistocerca piceifrons]
MGVWSSKHLAVLDTTWVTEAPGKNNNKVAHMSKTNYSITRFATWNVRTVLPGCDTPTDAAPIVRKAATIDRELLHLRVDVAALQETRLSGEGSLHEDNYTFFWKGREIGERCEHGVGFAVRNSLLSCCKPPKSIFERLTTLRLKTTSGPVTLISAYAPTMKAPPEVKDMFCEDLRKCLENVRGSDKLMLLGDFNARVGNKWNNWTDCIGPYSIGNMNENGQRLLELCTSLSLCITNTYSQNRDVHKVTWKHPRSGHWHQLDFIITRRSNLRHVLNPRIYHSTDCDTDHSLVVTKSQFTPKEIHSAKSVCRRVKINTKAIQDDALYKKFSEETEMKLNPEQFITAHSAKNMWHLGKENIMLTAIGTFGKQGRTQSASFTDCESELHTYIDKKRNAHIQVMNNPTDH